MRKIEMSRLVWIFVALLLALPLWSVEPIPANDIMFRNISVQDGLSSNSITALHRDRRGFIWIGTNSGLNRYDSYNVQQYTPQKNSLNGEWVIDLFDSPSGNVWIKTREGGYSIYDYKKGVFNHDIKDALQKHNLKGDNSSSIGSSLGGRYFYVLDSDQIQLYDTLSNRVHLYPLAQKGDCSMSMTEETLFTLFNNGRLYSTNIRTSQTSEILIPERYHDLLNGQQPKVYADRKNGIWLHTYRNNLVLYKKSLLSEWQEILAPSAEDNFNRARAIQEDRQGRVWIITSHTGAFIYDRNTGVLRQYLHDQNQLHTLASNNLAALHIDYDGIVWIGNYKYGVSYYVPDAQTFFKKTFSPYNDIQCFAQIGNKLFVGTDGGGLWCKDIDKDYGEHIVTPANVLVSLKADSKDRLWMGTYQRGLLCYDHGKLSHFNIRNSNLKDNDIYGVAEDEDGRIWVIALNGNLYCMNADGQDFQIVMDMKNGTQFRCIIYGGNNKLYVATSMGLLMVDTQTRRHQYLYETPHGHSLPNGVLNQVLKDKNGNLWLGGTQGLTYWNLREDTVVHFDESNGLPDNFVNALCEDNTGQVWAGTVNGVARINLKQSPWEVCPFSSKDGLTADMVNEGAMFKLSNGNIFVGSPNGYTIILPQEVHHDTYNATIYLTQLESDLSSGGIVWNVSPECATAIKLHEEELPFLRIYFSTLDFNDFQKVSYAYRIKGKHADWIYTRSNQIDLSLLSSGKFELEIKACNIEGKWSPNIKTFTITVIPVWYKRWWFILICVLIILAFALYSNYRYASYKRAKESYLAQKEESRRIQQVNDMKMQFFANVSHELRTPLTLIINPLKEFMQVNPQYRNSLLSTVLHNSNYLLELINQLLDFRKLDAKGEVMNYVHGDMITLVKDQMQGFAMQAEKRNIRFELDSVHASIPMDFDYNKVQKILMNLLSNAFKFTPDGGAITIKAQTTDNMLILKVTDTGCGIPEKDRNKVFECFYQVDSNDNPTGSSGIGLYLVAQYTKMHKGTIQIEANEPQGSIFTLQIPKGAQFSDQQVQLQDVGQESQKSQIVEESQGSYSILIVDDNVDFLDFLSSSLATSYKTLKAHHGKEALQILQEESIDIVISDVMMPEMNGLELCKAIKNNIQTSHIPVILLTARAADEFQVEGLSTGADDYITKPFNMEILRLRISKIIDNNLKKHRIFDEQIKIEPSKLDITPLDRQLIEDAVRIVEANLKNAEFSVEELATQLNLSRGYLYKKIMKITGKSTLAFIRTIRLKRAQQLLIESQLQIAEIAYMLGYNSPKIFTKHFKEEFNMTPSEFVRKYAKEYTYKPNLYDHTTCS